MSTTPEGDGTDQQGGPVHGTHPGAPSQGGVPREEQYGGTPSGQVPPQPGGQQQGSQQQAERPGETAGVPTALTRVTGRRIVQYLIDAFLVGLIPSLVSIPFDRSDRTWVNIVGGFVFFVIFVAIGLLYWVILTHRQNGQTPGMKLLGLRVISKAGGPANMGQLTIRWICLILDAIPYTWPVTGLVGLIVMLFSHDRQRIGDHLARTLVISTRDL